MKNPWQYAKLKEVTGYIHSGLFFHNREAIAVAENCSNLLKQCQQKFGSEYRYIQSGHPYAPEWDTVKGNGEICSYYLASEH